MKDDILVKINFCGLEIIKSGGKIKGIRFLGFFIEQCDISKQEFRVRKIIKLAVKKGHIIRVV